MLCSAAKPVSQTSECDALGSEPQTALLREDSGAILPALYFTDAETKTQGGEFSGTLSQSRFVAGFGDFPETGEGNVGRCGGREAREEGNRILEPPA